MFGVWCGAGYWHVLGLRIQRAARTVEMTACARLARPSLRCGHVLGLRRLLDDQSYEVDAGKGPHTASKAEAEATARVDVGEVSMTLVSRGERQNKPASFQVFARWTGRHGRSSLGGYACLRIACSDCFSSSCFT